MSRYIDADKLQRHGKRGGVVYWRDIEAQPTADVRENVRGEWILTGEIEEVRAEVTKCSVCGCETWGGGHFCCGCGADMRGDNNGKRNDS